MEITEIRGHIFSATLNSGETLTLQPGETAKVKKSEVGETLFIAERRGIVTIKEVAEKKSKQPTENTTGGADK